MVEKEKIQEKIAIGEFGGGAGQFLNEIHKFYHNAHYTNIEIINDYKQHFASKKIMFIKRSILDSRFHDASFDVIIIRDVLHHLVGNNYHETLENQQIALKELRRLIRPGGAIFIEELTNSLETISRIIYHIFKLNLRLGIRLPFLSINPNVNVAFFTPHTLMKLWYDIYGRQNIVIKKLCKVKADLNSRLVHLGAELVKVLLVIEISIS